MKFIYLIYIAIVGMSFFGCTNNKPMTKVNNSAQLISWPKDWSKYLNQKVIVEGTAVDAKLGALLIGKGPDIWIDGLDAWPQGFYLGGKEGKTLRVTAVVIERADLPAFVSKEGEQKSGIPVEKQSDLEQAKKRFLLKDATWIVIEKNPAD